MATIVSNSFWNAYPNYNDYPKGLKVAEKVGGWIYEKYKSGEWVNTCALRISYGLNFSGHLIPPRSGNTGTNKNSDGRRYFTSTIGLHLYLTELLGPPLRELRMQNDVEQLKQDLQSGQVAIAVNPTSNATGHAAVVKKGYQDIHTPTGTMSVWILP